MLTTNNNDTPPHDIVKRLAELNRWQEEQKRALEERQNKQRQLLGIEQRNMYEMLGLMEHSKSSTDVDSVVEMSAVCDISNDYAGIDNIAELENVSEHSQQVQPQEKQLEEYDYEEETTHTEQTNTQTHTSGYGTEDPPATHTNTKQKRTFLRRGEGLKQRFHIDPDKLRLDKLPRYKFTNAHPQYKPPKHIKRSILKTKKSIPQQEKEMPTSLGLNEKHFQKLLINSKNVYNSTPDLKSTYALANKKDLSPPKVHFAGTNKIPAQESPTNCSSIDGTSVTTASPLPSALTWAKVLDSQQIKPLPVLQHRAIKACVDDDENISIFELMEQKANEGNFDMNSSCVRAFMAKREHQRRINDSELITVTKSVQQLGIKPQVSEVINNKDDAEQEQRTDESDGTLIRTETTLDTVSTPCEGTVYTKFRVRFSNSTDTHEYVDDISADANNDNTSNAELLDQFKEALFKVLEQRQSALAQPEHENIELQNVLQEKANLVKTRLAELEQEIKKFKENNTHLLRMKQEHELEKAQQTQLHKDAMERLQDEKIQFEIYLHDERIKLDEERRKVEQQLRLQKSNMNTKEKKEIVALKQEVEGLQQQLKQKEQAHVSAQARLRAQLRTHEKDQKWYYEEIERLTKENKRLEQELLRAGREQNNKMLQEINRNLARLAPKLATSAVADNQNTANVGKHTRRTKSLGTATAAADSKSNCKSSNAKPQRQSIYGVLNRHGKSYKENVRIEDSTTSISNSDDEDEDEEEDVNIVNKKQLPKKLYIQQDQSLLPEEEVRVICNNEKPKTQIKNAEETIEPCKDISDSKQDFKREINNADGSKDIWYPNGNLKKISADGMTVRMLYFNKDIKETDIRAGTIKYYYAETNTWHTTYLDGLEILEFPNGQTEHRHKSGVVEIHFPNNTIKTVDPNDELKLEEWRYADGTHLVQLRNGDKILNLPNGQKEIHTKLNKRREYPDGTVKIVYPDGSQETRYSNGRVRLKDKDGKLVMDTDIAQY